MWTYYGTKKKIAKFYPKPIYDKIIEDVKIQNSNLINYNLLNSILNYIKIYKYLPKINCFLK